jgi:hypothetical protein
MLYGVINPLGRQKLPLKKESLMALTPILIGAFGLCVLIPMMEKVPRWAMLPILLAGVVAIAVVVQFLGLKWAGPEVVFLGGSMFHFGDEHLRKVTKGLFSAAAPLNEVERQWDEFDLEIEIEEAIDGLQIPPAPETPITEYFSEFVCQNTVAFKPLKEDIEEQPVPEEIMDDDSFTIEPTPELEKRWAEIMHPLVRDPVRGWVTPKQ